MGFREYLEKSGNRTRWKITASLAVLFHAAVLGGGSWVMGQKAQYGVAGAVAGVPRAAPAEEMVELEQDDAPAERPKKSRPALVVKSMGSSGQVSAVPSYYLNPAPSYPMEARARKEEGVVLLHVEVDAQGLVVAVAVVQSSGFPDLDSSALEGVKGWRFKPAQIAGLAVSTSINIPVRFRLKDK